MKGAFSVKIGKSGIEVGAGDDTGHGVHGGSGAAEVAGAGLRLGEPLAEGCGTAAAQV
ncbi:hypothetical protein IQ279_25655 [Streptomyces verrucosisporus]|uniref:hypothetical protein n=1 Tax=Streptomyces verrucosisporus TaxID=1695161 RepID=UPI0019D0293D|nr:hypothetical protein [Streptomyces verrucosisporus]MBN3932951.1 hypothetical protein [Streptomyces verrucosisporus]